MILGLTRFVLTVASLGSTLPRIAPDQSVTSGISDKSISSSESIANRCKFASCSALKDGKPVKSRWLQRVKYLDDEAAIEVCFTYDVVTEISRVNDIEQYFTQNLLQQTSQLKSAYSVRLYELLVQWKVAKKIPVFELKLFRKRLDLGINEYKTMGNFKLRVLDSAVKEINEKTDLKISYEQQKKGRTISGFKFKVLVKDQPKTANDRDLNTADMFTVEGLNDNQLVKTHRYGSLR